MCSSDLRPPASLCLAANGGLCRPSAEGKFERLFAVRQTTSAICQRPLFFAVRPADSSTGIPGLSPLAYSKSAPASTNPSVCSAVSQPPSSPSRGRQGCAPPLEVPFYVKAGGSLRRPALLLTRTQDGACLNLPLASSGCTPAPAVDDANISRAQGARLPRAGLFRQGKIEGGHGPLTIPAPPPFTSSPPAPPGGKRR